MRWFVKAAVYATLLTWPGHLLAPAYQSLLLAVTGALIGRTLAPPADGAVDLSAANLLTVFVALALASDFTSWPRRLRALAIGIPAMVAIECATGILGMSLARGAGPADGPGKGVELAAQVLELSRWLGVPLLWGVLLGRHALRAPAARSAGAGAAPGGVAAPSGRR